ncbi:hypothetical protein [uncultured Campylobacter sp.]|uniref:hypothetical protein n=1 Tax=uncultured Campylobacter sp. TaxID=218934 RepID=UPI00262C9B41|nr:hypothetical protein [uncultured Campylobacter sp.]
MAFVFEDKISEKNTRKHIFDEVKADVEDKIDKGLLPFRCSLLYFTPAWRIDRELDAWLMGYGSFSGFWDHCNLDFNAYRLYYQGKMFDAVITYGAWFGDFRMINGQKRRIHKLYALEPRSSGKLSKSDIFKILQDALSAENENVLLIDALDYNIDYVGGFLIDGYRFEDNLEQIINPFRNQHGLASLSRDEIDGLWCISKELNEIFLIKVGSAGSNDLFTLTHYNHGYYEYHANIVLKQISNKTVDGINEIRYKIKKIEILGDRSAAPTQGKIKRLIRKMFRSTCESGLKGFSPNLIDEKFKLSLISHSFEESEFFIKLKQWIVKLQNLIVKR